MKSVESIFDKHAPTDKKVEAKPVPTKSEMIEGEFKALEMVASMMVIILIIGMLAAFSSTLVKDTVIQNPVTEEKGEEQ